MNVSIFQNFNEVSENLTLPAVLALIQNGRYKKQVGKLRELLNSGDKQEYDRQKKSLPAFTPSATFTGGRKIEYLDKYNGFIILDLDKLPEDDLGSIKSIACSVPFTFACFISPSNV
ncbi:virulence-associated E family protein, partial [Candidatus Nomurabacteria bacterium]|nr:virulence-associated E family protein [Candidatus Nomurabacteria bacterium]